MAGASINDVINLRVNLILAKNALAEQLNRFKIKGSILDAGAQKSIAGLEENVALANDALKTQRKLLNNAQPPFAGYAMSIMFAGMALQRFAKQVSQFGVKAFQEISESVAGTATNATMLQGEMKYLGYTIGSALEPVIGYLIPIIDNISEWVEKNPKLVAGLTVLFAVLGTAMAVGGGLKLAIDGFTGLKVALLGVSKLPILSISSLPILGVFAALAIIIGTITKAFNDNPFFKETIINGLFKPLGTSIKKVWDALTGIFTEIFGGTNIMDLFLGWWLILGRTLMNTIIPIFTALFDTIAAVFNIFRAFIKLVKTGDWKAFKENFTDSLNFKSTVDAAKTAYKDFGSMFSAIGNTGISFTGQMQQLNRDEFAQLGDTQKTYDYTATNKGQTVIIQDLRIESNNAGDLLRQLRAISGVPQNG
jgi:hypothetical protein